jgi:hypothetical protein
MIVVGINKVSSTQDGSTSKTFFFLRSRDQAAGSNSIIEVDLDGTPLKLQSGGI